MSSVEVAFTLEDDDTKTAQLEVHEAEDGVEVLFYIEDDNVLAIYLTAEDALEVINLLLSHLPEGWRQKYKP